MVESRLQTRIDGTQDLGGGCIAHATRLDTARGPLFLKWSRRSAAAAFPAEAEGLRALREASGEACNERLHIPEALLTVGAVPPEPGILILEWVEPGVPDASFWEAFGTGLAELHRVTGAGYGFRRDNFIGRLPQWNTWYASWPDFFGAMRIEPQVRMARDGGRWDDRWTAPLERLMRALDELLPARPEASILHGDLWSGNFLVAQEDRAALIDPAVYYGHRETDLAMTELFGGFDDRFYSAYRNAWPLEAGYELRRQVYNLYHLINHLNHEGAAYARSVDRILTAF
jgi:fructosamine-3-kinase